jgi:transcriptional regulator with XRE-family HTH domain
MKLEEAFGKVLKETRAKHNVSQEKLALTGGLDRTFISLLERGLRQPSLTTIFQIASALNEQPDLMVKRVKEILDESTKN